MDGEQNTLYLQQRAVSAKIVSKVAIVTLVFNVVLTVLKAVFGFIFYNVSVLSDAIHSFSDVGTTVLVLLSVVLSRPAADKRHNYGHEKIEPIIVLFFSLILGAVGVLLVVQGAKGIAKPTEVGVNYYLVSVTAFSIIIKEAMYWYTIHYAKLTGSNGLKADAWHHRSDSLSSVAVLLGLCLSAVVHTDIIQNIAVIVVAALIIYVAVHILKNCINQLIDKAADDTVHDELNSLILGVEGVAKVDALQTRLFGNAIYVDAEISVDGNLTVHESHKIAQSVHDKLEAQENYHIKHCTVHVNPNE